MINTVLIDIDDTLLDFDLCAQWAMTATAKELEIHLPENTYDIFKEINAILWEKLEKKEITSDELYCVRWNMVSQKLGIEFDGKQFEKTFFNLLSTSIIPVDGAVETLKYLKSKYRVFVASNGPYEQQVQRMKLAGMEQYLDGYFVSEQVGHSKPSKEFFEHCYRTVAVDSPKEIIMIGDSISADIMGASSFGMQSCWFNKKQISADNMKGYIIDNLCEIRNII